jgi:hypothetical protein
MDDEDYKRFLERWDAMYRRRIRNENVAVAGAVIGILVCLILSRCCF